MTEIKEMLPDIPSGISDMFGNIEETIRDVVDPLEIFSNEEKAAVPDEAPPGNFIDILDEMGGDVRSGSFDRAKDQVQRGKKSTKCGWCQEKLNRLNVDIDYAKNVCGVDKADECSGIRDAVGKKIEDTGMVLREVAEMAKVAKDSDSHKN